MHCEEGIRTSLVSSDYEENEAVSLRAVLLVVSSFLARDKILTRISTSICLWVLSHQTIYKAELVTVKRDYTYSSSGTNDVRKS